MSNHKKTALVHDWLFHMRGGERVLEAMAELFPDAEIYTLFYDKKGLSSVFQNKQIHASWLQYVPGIRHFYGWLLPLFPLLIKSLRIPPSVEVVISSSHCVAKGIAIPKNATHFCYCHTPMRYLWGFEKEYIQAFPALLQCLMRLIFQFLKKWDLKTNHSVHYFIANSRNVQARIKHYYQRESEVIYPPLDTCFFQPSAQPVRKNYYFTVSAFVPYKKVDIAIEAFNQSGKEFWVAGAGPMEKRYKAKVQNSNIRFLGAVSRSELRTLYQEAQAVIFPTNEDFGIVPLEAQACGTPVIAYKKGGALESVQTGMFFDEQTPEALSEAVSNFEKQKKQEPLAISDKVQQFSKESFQSQLAELINKHA